MLFYVLSRKVSFHQIASEDSRAHTAQLHNSCNSQYSPLIVTMIFMHTRFCAYQKCTVIIFLKGLSPIIDLLRKLLRLLLSHYCSKSHYLLMCSSGNNLNTILLGKFFLK